MRHLTHPLRPAALGTQRALESFHYGAPGPGGKAYIQASLHADELPGMLVAHVLRGKLALLEAAGKLQGEVIVVPVANPVGLAQTLLRGTQGRFELASGENFNRHYPAFYPEIADRLAGRLGSDARANAEAVRAAMRGMLAERAPQTELESLRLAILRLCADADIVLDLHCDAEAVLHLYTGTPLWDQCEPLARYLDAHATLLATESGDYPFDEACSQTWWQLEAHFKDRFPIPMACLSVTVELRGQGDVDRGQAEQDASRIVDFLTHRGIVAGEAPPLPPLRHPATPLAGSEAIESPVSGVVSFLKAPGDWIEPGEVVAEIIDPIAGTAHPLAATTAGVLYARDNGYFAIPGTRVAKVAGATAFRTGKLLSA